MTLHTRVTALERQRPPKDPALDGSADAILATLSEAASDEPLPTNDAVLDAVRRGESIACRSRLIHRK